VFDVGIKVHGETEHQLFEVTERSIFIDVLSKYSSNAFLDLFSNVLFLLQAFWQARWYLLSFRFLVSWEFLSKWPMHYSDLPSDIAPALDIYLHNDKSCLQLSEDNYRHP
jgi:hypothetical protein